MHVLKKNDFFYLDCSFPDAIQVREAEVQLRRSQNGPGGAPSISGLDLSKTAHSVEYPQQSPTLLAPLIQMRTTPDTQAA